jgi:hypothetical protein
MSMQPPHLRPCPECGGQRLYDRNALELWINGVHTNDYFLDAAICPVCGCTSLYNTNPGVTVPALQKALASQQVTEQRRLQKEWEKQQKRQGR